MVVKPPLLYNKYNKKENASKDAIVASFTIEESREFSQKAILFATHRYPGTPRNSLPTVAMARKDALAFRRVLILTRSSPSPLLLRLS